MKRNILLMSVVLFITLLFPAFTQNVEYVDIEATQNEIDELKAENQELTATVDDLRSENEQLGAVINREYKWVYRISEVISSMETLIKSLEYMSENTQNEDYQDKLQEMIDVNKNKIEMLKDKREELNESIANRKSIVEENKMEIRSTNDTIAKNENRILYLQVAMNRTKDLEDQLNLYSQRIDELIERLDAEIGEIESIDTERRQPEPVEED
jgi:chromosome segregation ATPase